MWSSNNKTCIQVINCGNIAVNGDYYRDGQQYFHVNNPYRILHSSICKCWIITDKYDDFPLYQCYKSSLYIPTNATWICVSSLPPAPIILKKKTSTVKISGAKRKCNFSNSTLDPALKKQKQNHPNDIVELGHKLENLYINKEVDIPKKEDIKKKVISKAKYFTQQELQIDDFNVLFDQIKSETSQIPELSGDYFEDVCDEFFESAPSRKNKKRKQEMLKTKDQPPLKKQRY